MLNMISRLYYEIMKNRKVKSNRAQADYFELLVVRHISNLYKLAFPYAKDLNFLSNQILKLPNGTERLRLQSYNLLKIRKGLGKILKYEISKKGKVVEINWVGRKLAIKTTSDIDTKHQNNKYTRFSIKSISETGTGTIKNLGMRSLNACLGITFDQEYREMWQKLRNYSQEHKISQSDLKRKVLRNKKLLAWATQNGQKYQRELNKMCLKGFNNLSRKRRTEFLNFILDTNDKDLYVIIVNSRGVIMYKPVEKGIELGQKIEAKGTSDVGYTIFIDNVPTYRIQTNATNGIGISAFCQRAFFADSQN